MAPPGVWHTCCLEGQRVGGVGIIILGIGHYKSGRKRKAKRRGREGSFHPARAVIIFFTAKKEPLARKHKVEPAAGTLQGG